MRPNLTHTSDLKRRILFYYNNYCGEGSRGGTEVATARIASALKKTGNYDVYHVYQRGDSSGAASGLYAGEKKLGEKDFISGLSAFIKENQIDAVVNMGRFFRQPKLRKAIELSGTDCKLIFMHHFAPGSEKKKTTFSAAAKLIRLNPLCPRYWLRLAFYPIVRLPRNLNWSTAYRRAYLSSDATVLLSEGYRAQYQELAKLTDGALFHAIPNIFDKPENVQIAGKEKRVLILSRMDELQKRVSLALKIWAEIENREGLEDWHLDIVGSGNDLGSLRKLAKKLNLKRATFHGWSDGKPFLEKSSIFMMTSDFEGLSLSMIEAQAYGCVPIAFDSYASLKDIVTDGQTGVSVSERGGIAEFAAKLEKLMVDDSLRQTLSLNAAAKSDDFASEKVAEKWDGLFNQVLK